jgi:hypothetical protein
MCAVGLAFWILILQEDVLKARLLFLHRRS